MLVKQLLKMEIESEDKESPRLRTLEQVDASEKTKLYITLDNMLDYLEVYRDKLKGSRVPFYQAKFLEK
jgi:hypothetical protein